MRRLFPVAFLLAAGPALAADHTLFFEFDSAQITSDGRAVLETAAVDYRETGQTSVSIVGFTDTAGPAEYNLELSERRARAATEALVAMGVPPQSITVGWRGENELAVPTADGVREQANRRVEITIAEPAAEPEPAPAPMVEQMEPPLKFSVGPYIGFNLEDPHDSYLVGANLTVSYNLTEQFSLSAEQAVFYALDTLDEGVGGRSAVGLEYDFSPISGLDTYVGANGGYMYIDGSSTGGFFAGPEVGVRFENFEVKAAYDFVEDRDWDEGVISVTAGVALRF